jgi:DNA-binding PadR family transcriptional regulator
MQKPRMIVLALIGTGLRYGFEMESFARRTEMRQWAKIGMSTIYKVLKDLERDGAISVELEESDKGPPRKAYSLTPEGRKQMAALIRQALASKASVYSERIAGLIFAPLLGVKQSNAAISQSISGLEYADAKLEESLQREGMDIIGRAVVDYYRAIYDAELVAMRKIMGILESSVSNEVE